MPRAKPPRCLARARRNLHVTPDACCILQSRAGRAGRVPSPSRVVAPGTCRAPSALRKTTRDPDRNALQRLRSGHERPARPCAHCRIAAPRHPAAGAPVRGVPGRQRAESALCRAASAGAGGTLGGATRPEGCAALSSTPHALRGSGGLRRCSRVWHARCSTMRGMHRLIALSGPFAPASPTDPHRCGMPARSGARAGDARCRR